jgi:hypothetical protein
MKTLKYLPLFLLIQAVSLVLGIIGIPICAALAYTKSWTYAINMDQHHWKWKIVWLWDNDEDGIAPWHYLRWHQWSTARTVFTWTALRNPVNNLRFVPGVSKIGRPLWRIDWDMFGKAFYAQAGWRPTDGWPVLSTGAI